MRRLVLVLALLLPSLLAPAAAHAADGVAPRCAPAALDLDAGTSKSVTLVCSGGTAPVTLAVRTNGSRGVAALSGSDVLTYTANATGDPLDRVAVVATDADGDTSAPLTVEIGVGRTSRPSCAAAPPIAVRPNATNGGTAVCEDSRSSSLTYAVTTAPTGATVKTGSFGTSPAFSLLAGGAEGDARFAYAATGAGGTSLPVSQPVTVTAAANVAPVCLTRETVRLRPGSRRKVALTCTDADADRLTVAVTGGPGRLGAVMQASGGGSATVVYTAPDEAGPDSFTFTATDTRAATSPARTVTVDVDPAAPNTSPSCPPTTVSARRDASFDVVAPCTDADNDQLDYALVSSAHVTVGTPVVTDAGTTFPVTLEPDYTGTGAGFEFTVGDGTGDARTEGEVSIAIDRNGPGCTTPARGVLRSGRFVTVSLAQLCPGATGFRIVAGADRNGSTGAIGADDDVAFQASAGAADGTEASFAFVASDGTGSAEPVTVAFATGPGADRPPACSAPATLVRLGAQRTIALDCTDADGDPLSVTVAPGARPRGTVVVDGTTLRYTAPASGGTGTDTFPVLVSDGFLGGEIRVDVPVMIKDRDYDTPPVCTFSLPIAPRVSEARPFTFTCSDAEGDPVELIEARNAVNGSVEALAASASDPNRWTGRFQAGADAGSGRFEYAVTDGLLPQAALEWKTVTFDVREAGANTAPSCASGSVRTMQTRPVSVTPAATCADPDGDTLVPVLVTGPSNGTLTPIAGAGATYTAAAGFTGTDGATFMVHDGHGASAPVTVQIAVDDPPVPDPDPEPSPTAGPGAGVPTAAPGGGGGSAAPGTTDPQPGAAGGGGAAGSGPAPSGPDTTAPALDVKVTPARLRKVVRQGLRVKITCGEACTTGIVVSVPARLARRLGLARKPTKPVVVVRTSGTGVLRLRFSGRMAKVRKAAITVAVTATDAAGNRARRTVKVKLRR